jgi:hypothetical protein
LSGRPTFPSTPVRNDRVCLRSSIHRVVTAARARLGAPLLLMAEREPA